MDLAKIIINQKAGAGHKRRPLFTPTQIDSIKRLKQEDQEWLYNYFTNPKTFEKDQQEAFNPVFDKYGNIGVSGKISDYDYDYEVRKLVRAGLRAYSNQDLKNEFKAYKETKANPNHVASERFRHTTFDKTKIIEQSEAGQVEEQAEEEEEQSDLPPRLGKLKKQTAKPVTEELFSPIKSKKVSYEDLEQQQAIAKELGNYMDVNVPKVRVAELKTVEEVSAHFQKEQKDLKLKNILRRIKGKSFTSKQFEAIQEEIIAIDPNDNALHKIARGDYIKNLENKQKKLDVPNVPGTVNEQSGTQGAMVMDNDLGKRLIAPAEIFQQQQPQTQTNQLGRGTGVDPMTTVDFIPKQAQEEPNPTEPVKENDGSVSVPVPHLAEEKKGLNIPEPQPTLTAEQLANIPPKKRGKMRIGNIIKPGQAGSGLQIPEPALPPKQQPGQLQVQQQQPVGVGRPLQLPPPVNAVASSVPLQNYQSLEQVREWVRQADLEAKAQTENDRLIGNRYRVGLDTYESKPGADLILKSKKEKKKSIKTFANLNWVYSRSNSKVGDASTLKKMLDYEDHLRYGYTYHPVVVQPPNREKLVCKHQEYLKETVPQRMTPQGDRYTETFYEPQSHNTNEYFGFRNIGARPPTIAQLERGYLGTRNLGLAHSERAGQSWYRPAFYDPSIVLDNVVGVVLYI
jgi:hypothetical protein